jgi:hypothetical protein
MKKNPKITVRKNAWDNWYGYVGGRKAEMFFGSPEEQESQARSWAEKMANDDAFASSYVTIARVSEDHPNIKKS